MITPPVTYRSATPFDAPRIAELHASSWQENYRGAMSDHYLDAEAPAERLSVWTGRFSAEDKSLRVWLAEEEDILAGFCCVVLGESERDGTLLDNLHVRAGYRGTGIGRYLLNWAAEEVLAYDPAGKLYLWVLEQNTSAMDVYRHLGGTPGRRELRHLSGMAPEGVGAIAVHFDPGDLQRRTAG
ncbi:GNAT family N-acetyltransferase [Lewinella sp. IMCC34183]|uniref:GNAT family N-acetyltransferase n=1 Tax=Lewinella sp. IMCC34183 TaxID=2248762 RepID=UPI0013006E05|nr:GNAT family N-acetyltransferase [Lewinella sp. IMCC34183]